MTGLEAAKSLQCDLDDIYPKIVTLVSDGEVYWTDDFDRTLQSQIAHLHAALEVVEES